MIQQYIKGTLLTANANATTSNGFSITEYSWKVDENTIINNNDQLLIDTNILDYGLHTVSVSAKNSCNNWSTIYQSQYEVIGNTNMTTTTLTATINSPIQTINIVLNITSLVTVNVLDQLNQPVASASVTIGTNPVVETNLSGTATVPDVLYGEHVITVTK